MRLSGTSSPPRRVFAAFLAALTLFVAALGFSPALHHVLHAAPVATRTTVTDGACDKAHSSPAADGLDQSHVCAVTLFSQGVLLNGVAPVLAPVERIFAPAARPAEFIAPAAPTFLFRPARGPPSANLEFVV